MPGVDAVRGDSYLRAAVVEGARGWVEVGADHQSLSVQCSPSLSEHAPELIRRVVRMFDLELAPAAMLECLGELAAERPGLRLPGYFEPFEAALRTILGQHVSEAAARTFGARLAQAHGQPVSTPWPELAFDFPTPQQLSRVGVESLRLLGLTGGRCRALQAVALACCERPELLDPAREPQALLSDWLALPGVGPWTAHTLLMRGLGWRDGFPHGDLGVCKALGVSAREALRWGERFRPWRGYATAHLWRRLG